MSQGRLIGRNVLVTLITQIISWGLAFSVAIFVPRYLGDVGMGKFAVAASVVAVFSVFVPLGTSMVLVKEIARDHSRTGQLLSTAIVLRVPLGIVMTLCAVLAGYILHLDYLTRLLVIVMSLGMVVGTINDALGAAIQGHENMTRQSVAVLVEKFLNSGITISFVILKQPIWTFAAVGIVTGIVAICVNLDAFKALLPTLQWPTLASIRNLAAAGMPFMGWLVFATLYGQVDPIIIHKIAGDATVGWYSVASRVFGTTLFLPSAIISAIVPTLARLYTDDIPKFQQLSQRSLLLIMLCAIPVAAILMFLPKSLIALMHYPSEFQQTIPVLRVASIGVLLWYANNYIARLIMACDAQALAVKSSIIATVLTIPLCIIFTFLTHRFWANGAVGAFISDVVVEFYLMLAYLKMLPPGTLTRQSLAMIGRGFLASVPMLLLFAASSALKIGLWIVLPCIIVYIVMCWFCGCLTRDDLEILRGMFLRKINK